jgi:ferredoxin
MMPSPFSFLLLLNLLAPFGVQGFQTRAFSSIARNHDTRLEVVTSPPSSQKTKEAYVPKWKKKQTLAEEAGLSSDDPTKAGLIGTIPVIFNQGNETKTTLALVGQPLSDVAVQAGQYIRYSCKKGECGTCACKVDGAWVRPCVSKIPALEPDQEAYTVTLKAIKNKSLSSGKFYSVRSFFMGFYNNILGMAGFVKQRRQARKNFSERMEIEDRIATLAKEKKLARKKEKEMQS